MSSSAAAALLIRRTSCVRHCLSRRWSNPPCRTFSDKTLTLSPTGDDAVSGGGSSQVNKDIERRRAVPELMVFSEENPLSSSFFSLSRSTKDGTDQNFLNFDREIGIPEAAAADKKVCLGSPPEPFYSSSGRNKPMRSERRNYFRSCVVESPDGQDLFLVYRQKKKTAPRTKYFRVFKLDERGKWERARSIGDTAIFVGINQSVSLRASEFPHILKPNSIYFTESNELYHCGLNSHARDTGVFSLDDKSIQFLQLTKGQDVVDWPAYPPAVWYIPPTPPKPPRYD